MGTTTISTTVTTPPLKSRSPMKHDPTIYLLIGPTSTPLAASQSLLTQHSRALHRHLRAQVPNRHDYATRDKTMRMAHELPATVARFLYFLEHGQCIGDVRQLAQLLVFAEKYEVPRMRRWVRRRLAGMVAVGGKAGEEEEEEE